MGHVVDVETAQTLSSLCVFESPGRFLPSLDLRVCAVLLFLTVTLSELLWERGCEPFDRLPMKLSPRLQSVSGSPYSFDAAGLGRLLVVLHIPHLPLLLSIGKGVAEGAVYLQPCRD